MSACVDIAKLHCNAKPGRYRGTADIAQAAAPLDLAEATD